MTSRPADPLEMESRGKQPETADRLVREAAFHDECFAEHSRSETDRFYTVTQSAFQRYSDEISRDVAGKRVLEYGCGPGSYAFRLAASGAEVVGVDISPTAIDISQRLAGQHGVSSETTFRVMNAEALTFSDESFDLVCGSGILHHLDLTAAYAEVARVLKPRGRGVFLEPLGHNPAINRYRRRTPQLRTPDEHPLVRGDVEVADQWFSRVDARFFNLLTLAATPLRSTRWFRPALRVLDRCDRALLAPRSPLRWHGWMVVLVLQR